MKRFTTFALGVAFAAIFSVSAFAQAGTVSKIGWIDTGSFGEEKNGVTKYINALKALDAEMKPFGADLQTIQTKLNKISEDLATLQKPGVPVDQKAILAKQDEGQRLQREGEFKKKEFDARVERRSGELLGPVSADISKAIQDYAKLKGYAVVLDIAALASANAILALDPASDITKEFITYYNARPGSTASTAIPK